MARLIIISNRLPVTIGKKEGALYYHPSAGGLATGLNSLDETMEKIWIGWSGTVVEDEQEKESIQKSLAAQNLVPVFLSSEEIELYYEGFSNKVIWPHFHYFTQYTTYQGAYWEAYQAVNKRFAEIVFEHLQEGDLVWVHDYQLMLLPALIRERYPQISIGFFLHIPFPSYEIFRMLPWRHEILMGLLGADQIGFHTFGYMRHFLSATYRITGHEHNFGKINLANRTINVDVFPMGIDYEKYAFPDINVFKEDKSFKVKHLAKDRVFVLSIDRLDYTKGIPQRFRVFEKFIERYPNYREKVTLVNVVVPSRSNVEQYQELKDEVNLLAGEINGKHGTFSWNPIQYLYRSLESHELHSLYKVADIAMITPLRDGMNLVAKEFIAAKEQKKKGVLILSEMAGASNELTSALIVNPQDPEDMINALVTALEMNEKEQRWRLEKMQEHLKKRTVKFWAETFIKEQVNLMSNRSSWEDELLNEGQKAAFFEAYSKAKKCLLVLDYDGTLMNFQNDPQAVVPDSELIAILSELNRKEGNKLVVNSGRDKGTLEKWLGKLELNFVAEHGVWVKTKTQWKKNASLVDTWKKDIKPTLETLVERTPGSFIEEKDYSLAWHYRMADRELGEKRVREFGDVLRYLTANLGLQVLEGDKVVEIKNSSVNKGAAMRHWLLDKEWDFILAIGDDTTDEDIFKALPKESYTFKVGGGASAARHRLASVEEVRELLAHLSMI